MRFATLCHRLPVNGNAIDARASLAEKEKGAQGMRNVTRASV